MSWKTPISEVKIGKVIRWDSWEREGLILGEDSKEYHFCGSSFALKNAEIHEGSKVVFQRDLRIKGLRAIRVVESA